MKSFKIFKMAMAEVPEELGGDIAASQTFKGKY